MALHTLRYSPSKPCRYTSRPGATSQPTCSANYLQDSLKCRHLRCRARHSLTDTSQQQSTVVRPWHEAAACADAAAHAGSFKAAAVAAASAFLLFTPGTLNAAEELDSRVAQLNSGQHQTLQHTRVSASLLHRAAADQLSGPPELLPPKPPGKESVPPQSKLPPLPDTPPQLIPPCPANPDPPSLLPPCPQPGSPPPIVPTRGDTELVFDTLGAAVHSAASPGVAQMQLLAASALDVDVDSSSAASKSSMPGVVASSGDSSGRISLGSSSKQANAALSASVAKDLQGAGGTLAQAATLTGQLLLQLLQLVVQVSVVVVKYSLKFIIWLLKTTAGSSS